MSISIEQVEQWLASTISSEQAAVKCATASLESAESIPGFPFALLTLASGCVDEGRRLAAATYLKNLMKTKWHKPEFMAQKERQTFRNQLVDALLRSKQVVLKTFAESLRFIIDNDLVRENTWPELVPAMKVSLQNSSLLNGSGSSEISTYNALIALQTVIKPFQYFLQPTLAKEPVPEQLELISAELLSPLLQLFYLLVNEAKASTDNGSAANDNSLLVLCKCFHLAVRSHMPSSLQCQILNWCEGFFTVLATAQVQYRMEATEQVSRIKAWKRSLQVFCSLVTRHRKCIEKVLPTMSTVLLDLVTRAASAVDLSPMQERVVSSAFDAISNILETGPGWRLVSSHFSSLLERAIFPALKLTEKDVEEWTDDQEEYLRKNLPSDLDDASGWRDDLYTPRRSALNLLGLISTSKGPPSAVSSKNNSSTKRKKAGKDGKSKESQGTAGELLIVPFLSKFPVPPNGSSFTSEEAVNYYGALLAYGGLQQFLKAQKSEHICMLIETRILPLYSMSMPSPFLLANANWVLGEFAPFLPEEMNKQIYDAVLKAFLAPDVGDLTWRPVRSSAAAAISALLQEEYKPTEWLPILHAAISGAKSEDDDEATIALQVLSTAADAGDDEIVPYLPSSITAICSELHNRIPYIPEPWPQVVESGFSAIASLAQTWDSSGSDTDGDGLNVNNLKSKEGCVTIGNTISQLLQKAWLTLPEDETDAELSPPSSCLNDASALVALMVKYTTDTELVDRWRIQELVHVWSGLIAEWSAWDEEEDLSVFDAIKEIISLQGRSPLPHFAVAPPKSPGLLVQPHSILEGITMFITSGIETAYSAATWRSCRHGHALLHVSSMSFDSDEITPALSARLAEAAIKRVMKLSSNKVPLAKPLVLLIAMCYACSPEAIVSILSQDTGSGSPLIVWGEALAELPRPESQPGLSLESELQLIVMVFVRLLEDLCKTNFSHVLKNKIFQSLLVACVRLKELQDVENDSNMEDDENESDDEDEDEDTDLDDESDGGENLEETEEQFLQRYAERAKELEKEALEEAEGGEEEDGQELEIGVLGLSDQMASVYNFLQKYSSMLVNDSPDVVVHQFVEAFPDSSNLLQKM